MTAEELFELPDDGYCHELVDGDLVRMTLAGAEHGAVTACISQVLREYVVTHGAGRLLRRRNGVRPAAHAWTFVSNSPPCLCSTSGCRGRRPYYWVSVGAGS